MAIEIAQLDAKKRRSLENKEVKILMVQGPDRRFEEFVGQTGKVTCTCLSGRTNEVRINFSDGERRCFQSSIIQLVDDPDDNY